MKDFEVRPATLEDLIYIDHLQRKNAEDLSFYPMAVFEREIKQHRILIAWMNAEPCGYLYHGSLDGLVRIHQACIQYDLRGYLYGAALVRALEALAVAAGSLRLSLRCGSDIAANGFWKAMGYLCVSIHKGGLRRYRDINVWQKPINQSMFEIQVTPSEKQKDSSIWRKSTVRSGSGFHRGNQMLEYRRLAEIEVEGEAQ
tara:strand:+ start:835 stop:1434 length:600 start_codon:yes stop_codon:yes gene_type:complete